MKIRQQQTKLVLGIIPSDMPPFGPSIRCRYPYSSVNTLRQRHVQSEYNRTNRCASRRVCTNPSFDGVFFGGVRCGSSTRQLWTRCAGFAEPRCGPRVLRDLNRIGYIWRSSYVRTLLLIPGVPSYKYNIITHVPNAYHLSVSNAFVDVLIGPVL